MLKGKPSRDSIDILKSGNPYKTKINVIYNPKHHRAPLLSAGRESVSQSRTSSLLLPFSWIDSILFHYSFSQSPFTTLTRMFNLLPQSLVYSLLHQSVVLCDALSSELLQDIVKVSGVREAVACQVGAKLSLMVDLKREGKICLSL